MAIRIAIIDGTGPEKGYEEAMAKSFCRTLANQLGATMAFYQRGPTAAGCETLKLARQAMRWLYWEHLADPEATLMLAGYSRGGSAAIMAAEGLNLFKIPVHSMFLFDPVARHLFEGGEVIPENVAFSRAAVRDQSWRFVMKYEGTISDSAYLGASSNPTRPSFGNTGFYSRGSGDHERVSFIGSHGALGGVGWKFVEEDRLCLPQVAGWMERQMSERGLSAKLGAGYLDPVKPLEPMAVTKMLGKTIDAALVAKNAYNRAGMIRAKL